MKKYLCLIIIAILPVYILGQSVNKQFESLDESVFELSLTEQGNNSISKFALSINPLGFLQFGPVINGEFGLTDNLVLNTHLRFPSLGLLTYATKYHDDGISNLSGFAFGGGVLNFFGDNMSKPYVGGLLEYHTVTTLYAQGASWEWENKDNHVVIIVNGGYRFRFSSGFFINLGGYVGAAVGTYNWNYTDPSYSESGDAAHTGSDVFPFIMVEGALGIEF